MEKKIIKKVEKAEKTDMVDNEEEVSVITEAIVSGDGNFRYVVSSNKNLKLGLCNISN